MAERLDEDDDEYWNSSEQKPFNFEDDESGGQLCGVSRSGTAKLSQQVREGMIGDSTYVSKDSLSGSLSRATVPGSSQSTSRPLHTLISEKSLHLILEAGNFYEKQFHDRLDPGEELRILRRKVEERWVPPPATKTVTKILLGHPYSLELYRSLESKTELLDAAISVGDGNAILAVVLFLVQTLNKRLVNQLLRTRPDAVIQYCQYLSTRFKIQELSDLLDMFGDSREASMKYFQLAICGTVDPNRRLQKLRTFLKSHFSSPDSKDRSLIENYIKLLEWQISVCANDEDIAKNLVGQSVLESLAYSCQHHWGKPQDNICSPFKLGKQQGVSDKQFQWTVLTVRASMSAWNDIDKLFITKSSWLSSKKWKASIPVDQVVMQLHKCRAPADILAKYLELIDNVDKRIALAQKLQCHKVVIDVFVSRCDRDALNKYKTNLHPQSEDYFYAENAVRASTVKWKN